MSEEAKKKKRVKNASFMQKQRQLKREKQIEDENVMQKEEKRLKDIEYQRKHRNNMTETDKDETRRKDALWLQKKRQLTHPKQFANEEATEKEELRSQFTKYHSMYTKKAREKANELKQSNETSDQRQIRQVQRELDQDKTKTTWKKKRSCQLRRPRFELKYTHSSTCLCQQVNQDLPPDIITQIPTLVFVNPVPPTAQDANEFGADDEQPINEEDSWRTRTPLEDERSEQEAEVDFQDVIVNEGDDVGSARDVYEHCDNCMRSQIRGTSQNDLAHLSFQLVRVESTDISKGRSWLRQVKAHSSTDVMIEYNLCKECTMFLQKPPPDMEKKERARLMKKKQRWEYTWPSFFWNLLSGSEKESGKYFQNVYTPKKLWKFVPTSLRPQWIRAIRGAYNHELSDCEHNRINHNRYSRCTISFPEPYFVDRSEDVKTFQEKVESRELKQLLTLLRAKTKGPMPPGKDEKPIMIPDVLCPWGCTEFCFEGSHCNTGLIIQNHLRKVELNFPSTTWYHRMFEVETSRNDYFRDVDDGKDHHDFVLLNNNWPVLPSCKYVPGEGVVIQTCRHHASTGLRKRLYPHPPRKPMGHNLSPEGSDELCHCKIQPRTHRNMRPCKYCTKMRMNTQQASFAGVDSANIDIGGEGRFSGHSVMHMEQEALSCAGRPDINHLMSRFIGERIMTPDLAEDIRSASRSRFAETELNRCRQGSTYVNTPDSMVLHQNPHDGDIEAVVLRIDRRANRAEEVQVALKRSWLPLINFLHTEDANGHGTPMPPVKFYMTNSTHSSRANMIQWAVASCIVGCKEMHRAIDTKEMPFHHDHWSGHMMAHLHSACIKFDDCRTPKGSPFKPKRQSSFILKKMEKCLPLEMGNFNGEPDDSMQCYFRFGINYWRKLFPEDDFTSISIKSSIHEVTSDETLNPESKDVIIIVGTAVPSPTACPGAPRGHIVIGRYKYEAKVILSIDASRSTRNNAPYKFTADRFTRHGNGFTEWWKQSRNSTASPVIMTKYRRPNFRRQPQDFPTLRQNCFQYITVYAKVKDHSAEDFRLDLHTSLGGQGHVYCKCQNDSFPLIVTGTHKDDKRQCMTSNCDKKELYVCSNPICNTRICKNCFDKFPKDGSVTNLTPPEETIDATSFSTRGNSTHDGPPIGEAVNEAQDQPEGTRDQSVDIEECEDGIFDYDELEYIYNDQDEEGHATNNQDQNDVVLNSHVGDIPRDNDEIDDDISEVLSEDGDNDSDERQNDDFNTDVDQVDTASNDNERGDHYQKFHYESFRERMDDVNDLMKLQMHSPGATGRDIEDEILDDYIDTSNIDYEEPTIHPEAYVDNADGFDIESNFNDPNSSHIGTIHAKKANSFQTMAVDQIFAHDFLTDATFNPIDIPAPNHYNDPNTIPATSAGDMAYEYVDRNPQMNSVPCHVLFNQAGTLCMRYNNRITGTQAQQNFIQRVVSMMQGFSCQLLYLTGMLFPRHYWSSATHDRGAILGAAPISCYTSATNPHGFASTLAMARNLATHSSSSTSTCPNFLSFMYDVQANKVAGGIDSRIISRNGFVVDVKSSSGISTRGKEESKINESVDSHQAALDLAGSQPFVEFDWFFTFTGNQAEHPGLSHLHEWKMGMDWIEGLGPNLRSKYHSMLPKMQDQVNRSFEMAYGAIMGRCWMEVRKLWLEYITFSTTSVLGGVRHVFFRDEYQEESGNLPHIHGLVALMKRDMENAEFRELICELQKCSVGELFDTSKMQEYIDMGIFENEEDWNTLTALGGTVLPHRCGPRCKRRIGPGDGPENFVCRKPHSLFGKINPQENEFIPLPYDWTDGCLEALERCGLWKPPSSSKDPPNGTFMCDQLVPKRHMGRIHPEARCNMSPVIPELFGATKSMQNAQVITGTNGVARYVVKYIVKLDQGNRCTVWADPHSGAVMQIQKDFLHNTKITSSKINEDKAHEKSRKWYHPTGRAIAFTEMQQQILGYPEVMTTMNFIRISTKPFELRSTTKLTLDERGRVDRDKAFGTRNNVTQPTSTQSSHSSESPNKNARERLGLPPSRQMTLHQQHLFNINGEKIASSDKIIEFSLRPVELMELFRNVGEYFRWFHIEKKPLKEPQIYANLHDDVNKSKLIDGVGRVVTVRRSARKEVMDHLSSKLVYGAGLNQVSDRIGNHFFDLLEQSFEDDRVHGTQRPPTAFEEMFIHEDGGEELPIPVFSSVTPKTPAPFLLHMMLMLGEYDTEMDLKTQPTMLDALIKTNLIRDGDTAEEMVNTLIELVVTKIMRVQPVTLRRLDEYIVMSHQLFEGVVERDEISINEIPSCILTQMLDDKDKELDDFRLKIRNNQVEAIYTELNKNGESHLPLPQASDVFNATKSAPLQWNALESFCPGPGQSTASFDEQRLSIQCGTSAINKYTCQTGRQTLSVAKGLITHGAPGSGKSFVAQYTTLYALSQGLNVTSTALMGTRANALGGIHMHRLFALPVKRSANPYRLAELAIDKLHRKSQLKYLHVLRTTDLLYIDECGQLSAQDLCVLDIILRKTRDSNRPFGGVVVIGTMDHTQLGAIQGNPFLVSSLILTNFNLVALRQSIRARGDEDFQEIQRITRISPSTLRNSRYYKERFTNLMKTTLTYVDSWDDVSAHVKRMYARRMPAYEACNAYVESCQEQFRRNDELSRECIANDYQRIANSRGKYQTATSNAVISRLNHGVKEPKKLLFWKGALFEATLNSTGYNQSQLLIMLDVPSQSTIDNWGTIELYAAPAGKTDIDLSQGVPSKTALVELGWKGVQVKPAPDRPITHRGIMGLRKQYSLRHTGSSTINKQMGNTIEGKCAVECTKDCAPWQKEQVVVCLSRTTVGKNTIIVGNRDEAIAHMWKLLTIGNQWTTYVESVLDRLSINGIDGDASTTRRSLLHTLDYPSVYPYRVCDIELPSDNSGYVYMLVSLRDFDRTYIGQTENLAARFKQHNSGNGARETRDPYYRPYCLAGYICNLGDYERHQREDLERAWSTAISMVINEGRTDVQSRLMAGVDLVAETNRGLDGDERIRFVTTFKSTSSSS